MSAVTVTIEDEETRSTMRHTAPGGKRTPEQQQEVARTRMQSRIRGVLEAGEAVEGMWKAALTSFPTSMRGTATGQTAADQQADFAKLDRNTAAEILADLLEEEGSFKKDGDRDAVLAILKDEARLDTLPRGSAAYVAAMFAVLGRRATTNEDSKHWQGVAGRWLSRGWK